MTSNQSGSDDLTSDNDDDDIDEKEEDKEEKKTLKARLQAIQVRFASLSTALDRAPMFLGPGSKDRVQCSASKTIKCISRTSSLILRLASSFSFS